MFENVRADLARLAEVKERSGPRFVLASLLFENGFQAVLLHRAAHAFRRRGIPFFGPAFARLSLLLTGVDISPAAAIGPGLRIAHGVGLVVGGGVRIGAGAVLLQQVTIGAASQARIDRMPVLGDNVFVGAGARLIGGITIGSDVFVGTNAVVTRDVPGRSKVVSTAGIEIVTLAGKMEPA